MTTWILQDFLLDKSRPADGPSFEQALRDIGCAVVKRDLNRVSRMLDVPLPELSGPVVTYGSFPFVRAALASPGVAFPGAYCSVENLSYHVFTAHLGDLCINDDYVMLPLGVFERRPTPDHAVFVRPDRVTKSFTGFAVDPDKLAFELTFLRNNLGVAADELVVVSKAKEIVAEYRYVIADGAVAAGSTYGWGEDFIPSPVTPPLCDAVAEKVARHPWQADSVYVCDVGMWRDGDVERAGVVELNTFSCAGLYACDTLKVARAVTRAAADEYGMA